MRASNFFRAIPHRNLLDLGVIVTLVFTSLAPAQAAVWHVSNVAGHPRDFTSVNAAVAAPEVADGDTLIIAGNYGESVVLTRPLHLIGYGYYHTENGISHPPTTQIPAQIQGLTVDSTPTSRADGGSVTGLWMTGGTTFNDVDGFTCRRNNMRGINIGTNGTDSARRLTIVQNYVRYYGSNNHGRTIDSRSGDNTDILIANNIIRQSLDGSIVQSAEDTMVIMNNVFLGGCGLTGLGIFANNIVTGNVGGAGAYVVQNNLAVGGNYLPAGDGNINSQVEADVFVLDASPDGKYKLKAGSAAIGAGLGGTDIGAYGGQFPYVLSGLPPIPVITNISAPTVVNDGETLSVQVRAEVHP